MSKKKVSKASIDPIEEPKFPFVSGKTLDKHLEIGRGSQANYRGKLKKGIYWVQPIPGGKILWNLRLIKDFFLQGEGKQHDLLIEEYLQSIAN